jgi:hypothetical protein
VIVEVVQICVDALCRECTHRDTRACTSAQVTLSCATLRPCEACHHMAHIWHVALNSHYTN